MQALLFSSHAIERMSQRHISPGDVEYVVRYGQKIYRAGMLHYFLGKRHIPYTDRANDHLTHLVGTIVLIESRMGQEVVTVYRNRRGTKNIRCKAKFNNKPF